ncbi:MAG: exodeoxyribonuclease VII large subunit [Candidatus Moranbacteria bacterium]|nr:exodeoxyribonuclease VII large subunit [Candidatus Moranbacteria bacterium]
MNNEILQKLKDWRDGEAGKLGKPSYYILSNDNLFKAVQERPQSKEELVKIKGWGEKKAWKYADKVLSIINESQEELSEDASSAKAPDGQPLDGGDREHDNVISVAEYINLINYTVQQFGAIKVKGEINDLSGMGSGLAFFNLRDTQRDNCVMQCVVFRRDFEYLRHLLEEGLEVVVFGSPSLYAPNGSFKFMVSKMEPVGEGAYKKALEKLKRKLQAKGYFEPQRKRPLPYVIQNIGLITSKNGAAIEDFRKNLASYGFNVYLKNVFVEGNMAESSIISAIRFFNKLNMKLDALVLIRGGGGWESLKTFNEEKLVEAVVESRLPVITGVGHQKDETLAGMASDADYSTPSIVATFLSDQRRKAVEELESYGNEIAEKEKRILERKYSFLFNINQNLKSQAEKVFYQFENLKSRFLDNLSGRLQGVERGFLELENFKSQAKRNVLLNLEKKERELERLSKTIDFLNPKNILSKGYSIAYNEKGGIIRGAEDIEVGSVMKVETSQAKISSKVIGKRRKKEK